MTMTASRSHFQNELDSGTTYALIESQQLEAATPFREFLSVHGCAVITRAANTASLEYHIVIGTPAYVKDILEHSGMHARKTLIILWGGEQDVPLVKGRKRTIVLASPVTPGASEIEIIFSIFFTSNEGLTDIRKKGEQGHDYPRYESKKPEPEVSRQSGNAIEDKEQVREEVRLVENEPLPFREGDVPMMPPSRVMGDEDATRIRNLLDEVFDKKGKAEKKQEIGKRAISPWKIFFACMVLPIVVYVGNFVVAFAMLGVGGWLLEHGDSQSIPKVTRITREATGINRRIIHLTSPLMPWGGWETVARNQELILTIVDDVAKSEDGIARVILRGHDIATQVASPEGDAKAPAPAVLVEGIRNDVFLLQTTLGGAKANLSLLMDNHAFPFLFPPLRILGDRGVAYIEGLRASIDFLDKLLTLYVRIGGYKQKQTFLILFQNSLELRPTGGFIGSVGIATFVDGRLLELAVHDVYDLDGQLKGHVDPPKPIAGLLGQEHWYLRDSNWDPDFSKSGERAAWFYQKESGVAVDGVIAVSVPFVVGLLKITGPVTLSDYNDQITAENFFGKSLYYTQADFFPGSTQKKDFLGSLYNALLTKLTASGRGNASALVDAIKLAIGKRSILFYFSDATLEALMTRYSWSGAVPAADGCPAPSSTSCLFDYLSLVEANLGVNKANYFVTRQGLLETHVSGSGSIESNVTLLYHNSSVGAPVDAGGVYTSYLRLFLSPDATPSAVVVDGAPITILPPNQKPPALLPYAEFVVSPHASVVGLAFAVPAGAERRITVTYTKKTPLLFSGGSATYLSYLQAQPGWSGDPMRVSISYPLYWVGQTQNGTINGIPIDSGKSSVLAKEASVEYTIDLTQDHAVGVKFIK